VAVVGIDESDVYCCCKRCGRWLNLLVKLAGIDERRRKKKRRHRYLKIDKYK